MSIIKDLEELNVLEKIFEYALNIDAYTPIILSAKEMKIAEGIVKTLEDVKHELEDNKKKG